MGYTLQLILAPSFGKGDSRREDRYLCSPRVSPWDKQINSAFLIAGVAELGLWNLEFPVPGLLLRSVFPAVWGRSVLSSRKLIFHLRAPHFGAGRAPRAGSQGSRLLRPRATLVWSCPPSCYRSQGGVFLWSWILTWLNGFPCQISRLNIKQVPAWCLALEFVV